MHFHVVTEQSLHILDSVVHSSDRDQTIASNSHLQEGKNNGKL